MPAVEIVNYHLILAEIRLPLMERFCIHGRDINSEPAGLLQNRPDARGSSLPIMIIDAIDDQNADLRRGECRCPQQQAGQWDGAQETHPVHVNGTR